MTYNNNDTMFLPSVSTINEALYNITNAGFVCEINKGKVIVRNDHAPNYVHTTFIGNGYDKAILAAYTHLRTHFNKSLNPSAQELNTLIIAGFPGVGKTFAANLQQQLGLSILDSDSSTFDKTHFPDNYINHIKYNIGKYDVIFVSTHEAVRKELLRRHIPFITVVPDIGLKNEFNGLYHQRGNDSKFIQLISDNWATWILECIRDRSISVKTLQKGETMTTFLKEIFNIK
jgi:hypothetical protein